MHKESTVKYEAEGRVARITLNRPDRLNAINDDLPRDLRDAVQAADRDDRVHVIVLSGAGRAFCAGYDLTLYAETPGPNAITQEMPWDPMADYRFMKDNTDCFMSLFRCYKPTIAKVHGYAVAGGSDIALCCDIVVMEEDARIGYMPARVWGCPTTAMWVYRVGPERAKRMLFTGDTISGREAAEMGLVLKAVAAGRLDAEVEALADRMAGIPRNQLMVQKLMINQTFDNMGLQSTQTIATLLDGVTRHTREGLEFKRRAEAVGWKTAVRERDMGLQEP